MKHTILFAAIASVLATNAYADTIVTSKKYVDDHDNLKVDIAQGVGTNNANVGKTLVVNSQGNLELGTVSADNFIEDSITDGVTNKAPSENAVNDALANKQNKLGGGTAGSLLANSGTAGTVDEVVMFSVKTITGNDSARYAIIANNMEVSVAELTELDSMVPSYAIVQGAISDLERSKQSKKECVGWPDNVAIADQTDSNCWLWELPN